MLNVLLKTAVAWGVIERVPCAIKLLRVSKSAASFYDFGDYEQLVEAARADGPTAYLVALLGGEAGLRCGEIMALEWTDVNLAKRQLTVARSEWKGHVTATKGGPVRYVPMTVRLASALRDARHVKGVRVLCDRGGASLTRKEVQVTMRRRVGRTAQVKTPSTSSDSGVVPNPRKSSQCGEEILEAAGSANRVPAASTIFSISTAAHG